ncbi:beta-1,3-galactosyltransferase 5-like [Ornithodoros turicata]|uniref:beta-1,3-galactosyltransferase 5-like n=1 Tax=Ornithodoros turicata TaxID=34597 RepID=UPI003138FEFF
MRPFKRKRLREVMITVALCSMAWFFVTRVSETHCGGAIVFYLPTKSPQRYIKEEATQTLSKRKLISTRHYSQPHPYVLGCKDLCYSKASGDATREDIDYLFLVSSAVRNFYHRNAIRSSWGRDVAAFGNNRLAFLLGISNDRVLQSTVESESALYSDIIQGNFSDTYRNLTLKSVMMLHWTTKYCRGIRFLVKVDDDTYLNIPNLIEALHTQRGDAIYGTHYHSAVPFRSMENKWYVSFEEYSEDTYPDYVGGPAYIISGGVLQLLYNATGVVKPFSMEDTYITGTCAERVGIPRIALMGVATLRLPFSCEHKKAIAGHYVTPRKMTSLWNISQRTTLSCLHFMFNWTFCYCFVSLPD